MGRQPSVIASNGDASPSLRAAGFATHLFDACLGTSALALSAPESVLTLSSFTPARWLGHMTGRNLERRSALDDDDGVRAAGEMAEPRPAMGCSAGRLRRCARAGLAVLGEPARLRIDAGHTRAAASAPRAVERAGRAAEVRDHLPAAAAGHTLPRPMGRRCLILAVAGAVACHEPITLAFPA